MSDHTPVSFDEFYAGVGRALTSWFCVEEGLADLFSRLTLISAAGTVRTRPEGVWVMRGVFHAMTNIPARLRMIDAIVGRLVTNEQLLAEWNSIQNKVSENYKRRNVLAHGAVWGNHSGALAIRGSIFAEGRKSLTFSQVCACDAAFKKLARRIDQLAIDANASLVSQK